jgi:hypothetical protein
MLIGITLAFLLAPLSSRCRRASAISANTAPDFPREDRAKRPFPLASAK